jgi:hypothetical protein
MTSHGRANVRCLVVGNYVDEAELPPGPTARGEVVRPRDVAEYSEQDQSSREFKILLREKSIVKVQGHALKHFANAGNPADPGSYAVLAHSPAGDVTVAIFPASEVSGIFHGEITLAKESA